VVVNIKQHKSQFTNSNITITQCQKNVADCVMVKFKFVNCNLCYIYNHDVTLTLYINWTVFLHKSSLIVDQSLPIFFAQRGRKRCQSNTFPILNISIRSGDIRAQSGKGFKIGPKIACFSPPPQKKKFWGQAHKFLDRRYKTEDVSEHDAKFRGDRRSVNCCLCCCFRQNNE